VSSHDLDGRNDYTRLLHGLALSRFFRRLAEIHPSARMSPRVTPIGVPLLAAAPQHEPTPVTLYGNRNAYNNS
jgi:hypothetical protein